MVSHIRVTDHFLSFKVSLSFYKTLSTRQIGINLFLLFIHDMHYTSTICTYIQPLIVCTTSGIAFLSQIDGIVALGESNGRLDQIIANINTLYKMEELLEIPVYLLSADSLTWVLKPGRHVITIASDLVAKSTWCSLVPVGQAATSVTTTGLKWNLSKY